MLGTICSWGLRVAFLSNPDTPDVRQDCGLRTLLFVPKPPKWHIFFITVWCSFISVILSFNLLHIFCLLAGWNRHTLCQVLVFAVDFRVTWQCVWLRIISYYLLFLLFIFFNVISVKKYRPVLAAPRNSIKLMILRICKYLWIVLWDLPTASISSFIVVPSFWL